MIRYRSILVMILIVGVVLTASCQRRGSRNAAQSPGVTITKSRVAGITGNIVGVKRVSPETIEVQLQVRSSAAGGAFEWDSMRVNGHIGGSTYRQSQYEGNEYVTKVKASFNVPSGVRKINISQPLYAIKDEKDIVIDFLNVSIGSKPKARKIAGATITLKSVVNSALLYPDKLDANSQKMKSKPVCVVDAFVLQPKASVVRTTRAEIIIGPKTIQAISNQSGSNADFTKMFLRLNPESNDKVTSGEASKFMVDGFRDMLGDARKKTLIPETDETGTRLFLFPEIKPPTLKFAVRIHAVVIPSEKSIGVLEFINVPITE